MPYHVALDQARESAARTARSARPAAASGPPTRTRSRGAAPRAGPAIDAGPIRAKLERVLGLPQFVLTQYPQGRPGAVRAHATKALRVRARIARWSPTSPAMLHAAARAGKRVAAVRGRRRAARHRPRHPSRSSPARTASPARRRAAASAPARSTTCSASSRRTRRASAAARSRPSSPDETGARLAKRGKRVRLGHRASRRCGWIDVPMLRRSLQLSGVNGLCITKLDVLDGLDRIEVCTGPRWTANRPTSCRPARTPSRAACQSTRVGAGLARGTVGAEVASTRCPPARAYLKRIEALTGARSRWCRPGPTATRRS